MFDTARYDRFFTEITAKIERYGKINLYLEDHGVEHFAIPAITKEILFKVAYKEHFSKIALVTDRKWIHACAAIENLFLPIQIQSYNTDERMDAVSWIVKH